MYRNRKVKLQVLSAAILLVTFFSLIYLVTRETGFSFYDGLSTESDIPAWVQSKISTEKADDIHEPSVQLWVNNTWIRIPQFCGEYNQYSSSEFLTSAGHIRVFYPDSKPEALDIRLAKLGEMMKSLAVQEVMSLLKKDPDVGVIDIGSQFVMFSLFAAMLGRNVIVVNPHLENILSLEKTAEKEGLTSHLTVLFTTPLDTYQMFHLRNPNLSKLCQKSLISLVDNQNEMQVSTIMLDDVLPFTGFEKGVIIMDAHSQIEALPEGIQLFHSIYVLGVLLEISPTNNGKSYASMESFLFARNFIRTNSDSVNGVFRNPNYVLWKRY